MCNCLEHFDTNLAIGIHCWVQLLALDVGKCCLCAVEPIRVHRRHRDVWPSTVVVELIRSVEYHGRMN